MKVFAVLIVDFSHTPRDAPVVVFVSPDGGPRSAPSAGEVDFVRVGRHCSPRCRCGGRLGKKGEEEKRGGEERGKGDAEADNE